MNQKTMTMALPSDTVSADSSHPTAKPPINYGHHSYDPITLQKAKRQLAYKTLYWQMLVFVLDFRHAWLQLQPNVKFCTYPHNFDSSPCQKHPFYSVKFDSLPFIPTMHSHITRSKGSGIHGAIATPSPEEKTKKRGTLHETPTSDKKTKTSAFQVMDLDPHAKQEGPV